MLEKSRSFLKERAKHNYREIGKVYEYIEQESKKMIEDGRKMFYLETQGKRKLYKK